jgi:tetratricopeptide (TPR) repeat protein
LAGRARVARTTARGHTAIDRVTPKRRIAALALLLAGCAGTQRPRAPPAAASPEAPTGDTEPRRYVSARAHQHVLTALLARERDDHETAARELREALLYDPESGYLRTLLAEELLRQGRVADAERELGSALDRDPRYAPAHVLAARVALAGGRADEARVHLKSAISADPQDPDAYRDLVRLEIARGDLPAGAGAAQDLADAAERAGADSRPSESAEDGGWQAAHLRTEAADAWLEVARAMADRQDDAGAQEAFARASALRPDTDETLAARAAFLESRRRWAEARELQLRLLARQPDSPEVLSALARLSLAEGELEVASAHLEKLRALATAAAGAGEEERRELGAALFRVAVPLLGAHRAAEAEAALEAALRLFPAHPELSFYRALALEDRGRHREAAQALEHLERALASPGRPREAVLSAVADGPAFLAPDPAQLLLDTRVQAALSRGRAGETAEAARRMKALFSADPRDEGVALGLLEAFDRAGHLPAAVALLEEAARKYPDAPALLYARASALDRAGRIPEALAAMRKVLAAAPAHPGALNYVGYVMTEQGGDLREAEGLLRRAVELRPDDGAIADSLGFCLLKEGRVDAALEELRRAARLSPGDPVILGHLGDALLASGRRDEAADAFRQALARLSRAPRSKRDRRLKAAAGEQEARSPEPGDERVRAELEEKLRSLTAR